MGERPLPSELPAELVASLDADVADLLSGIRAEAVRRVRGHLVDAYVAALEARMLAPSALATAPAEAPRTGADGGTGCYLYAVVAGDGTGAGAGLPGVQPDHPVSLVSAGGLTAIVSAVELARLSALTTGDDVSEDGPLALAVRAHDTVVDTAFRAGPVVPLRFGTVVADEPAAARLLRDHAPALRRELDHLARGREWGVKLHAEAAAESSPGQEPVRDGRDYLATKSRRRTERAELAQRHAAAADRLHAQLCAEAVDAVTSRTVTGDGAPLLLNASYLVGADNEPRFLAVLDRLADDLGGEGFRVERTGPWPPYHFVHLDLTEATP